MLVVCEILRCDVRWPVPSADDLLQDLHSSKNHMHAAQATERRIGEFRKRPTLMFNGYGEQVAGLYSGMDLRKDF